MKHVFSYSLLLIILSPLVGQSQIKSIGYYIDNSFNEITGYIDRDYEPEGVINCTVSELSYLKGGYTDLQNIFHPGEIKQENKFNKISFRSSTDNKLEVLKAFEITSFVMAKDSFITAMNFDSNSGFRTSGFLVKFLSNLTYQIYKYTGRNGMLDYYIKVDNELINLPKSNKRFKQKIAPLFNMYEELHSDILSGKYLYEEFNTIVSIYDSYMHAVNEIPYFYSYDWEQVDNKLNASYYSKIELLEHYKVNITYYDMLDNVVLKIKESRLNIQKKNGKHIWYYPNGHIKKEASYVAGNEIGVTKEYSETGRRKRSYVDIEGEKIYQSIYDEFGEELFKRNGTEVFYDEINHREITRIYENGILIRSFYIDSLGREIYQLADKNAKIKNDLSNSLIKRLNYPQADIDALKEGLVLAKILINPSGEIDSVMIIKGVSETIDREVIKSIASLKVSYPKQFKQAMVNKERVYQELIFPITFGFRTQDYYRNFYYDPMRFLWQDQNFLIHQQMMQDMQMQMIQQNMPNFPTSY